MGYTNPYRSHHYLGEHASDSAANTFVTTVGWDSGGNPQNGMLYYNTTSHVLKLYANGSWGTVTSGGQIGTWFQSYYPNTPSTIVRLWGQSANGFNPGYDVRLQELRIQLYSEQATQSALRIRVYRYDAGAATDRLILTASGSSLAVGYHAINDLTPDLTYQDLDSSAGDTVWLELDNGAGAPAKRVREISCNVKYEVL